MKVFETKDGKSPIPMRKRLLKWLAKFGKFFFFITLILLGVAFVSSLFEQKNHKQDDIADALANIDSLYAKVSDLESKIDDLESEKNENKSDIENVSSKVRNLTSHIDDLDDTLSSLERKVKSIELDMLFLKLN